MKTLFLFISLLLSVLTFSQTDKLVVKDGLFYSINGEVADGKYTLTYPNGSIESVFELLNGKYHGKVSYFYLNGNIKEIGNFVRGERSGVWERWDENGKKIAEASYNELGQKDGKWFIWDSNGNKILSFEYKNGLPVGSWLSYDDNGNIINRKEY